MGLAAIHLPSLYGMCVWLWSKDHYQFFPVVIFGVGYLTWSRVRESTWATQPPRLSIVTTSLGIAAAALSLLAFYSKSNWLGTFAAFAWLMFLNEFILTPRLARQTRGPLLLLALIIPLPRNLDQKLIISLQQIATTFASSLLDIANLEHTSSGVAISTANKAFMVEEACSGVHSLFSCVCVIAFVSLLLGHGFIRTLFNVIQTIGWVILANTIRVFLIVYSYTSWGIAIDSGIRHDLLGVFTYAMALSFSLSTDRLFLSIVPQQEDRAAIKAKPGKKSTLAFMIGEHNSSLLTLSTLALLTICFFSSWLFGESHDTGPQVVNTELRDRFAQILMTDQSPISMQNGWDHQSSKLYERETSNQFGQKSREHTFTKAGLEVRLSIDGEFPDWNDVLPAYEAEGWKLQERKVSDDPLNLGHTSLTLYSKDSKWATCIYVCLDGNGRILTPSQDDSLSIQSVLASIRGNAPVSPHLPVIQIRMFCSNEHELLDDEVASIRELFRRCLTTLQTQLNAHQE